MYFLETKLCYYLLEKDTLMSSKVHQQTYCLNSTYITCVYDVLGFIEDMVNFMEFCGQ